MRRVWGLADIHRRQKWAALSPYLSLLPARARLLDAGCGEGAWSLELAALHPQWSITAIDKDLDRLKTAEAARQRLHLDNVSFTATDFFSFQSAEPFDAVLSVASAHYLVHAGSGHELFARFAEWLRPGGYLFLFSPRRGRETPYYRGLPVPAIPSLFGADELTTLTKSSGLTIHILHPAIHGPGAIAKQLDTLAGKSHLLRFGFYPLEILLNELDRRLPFDPAGKSCAWVMVALKRTASLA
ncbi:MAG: class I SAM-dependent methyltransferase [Bryobacteraceae bacterium]